MSEPVIIGTKEVYDAVTKLSGQLEEFMRQNGAEMAVLKEKVAVLEQERGRKWQTQLAVGLAALSLIGSPVMALLIK